MVVVVSWDTLELESHPSQSSDREGEGVGDINALVYIHYS